MKVLLVGILLVLASLALILVVFLQKPKNEGVSALAANDNMKQLVGVVQMPSLLERATYALLLLVVFLSFVFSWVLGEKYL